MPDSIDAYVAETAARFNLEPDLETLIKASYDSGPLSTVISNLNSDYSFTVSGASELVLYSGTSYVNGGTQALANAYVAASSGTAYDLGSTTAGEYLNSDSTFSTAIGDIETAQGKDASKYRYECQ